MKKGLIIFAWISIVGSIGDGLIAIYGSYLVLLDSSVGIGISVESLIKSHIGFLSWVKQVAIYVMPPNVVTWLFGLPALVYFPIRVISSVLIGWWVLRIAKRMPSKT